MFKRIDLFEAGVSDYMTYRIPGIVTTPGGSLLAWCEARRGGFHDWVDTDIFTRRSDDGGVTWSPPQLLLDSANLPVHNCVMIADSASGVLHLLYCINYSRCLYCRSTDDGRTFSRAVEITHVFTRFSEEFDWNILATGPGHGIRLENGRLVVPVWMSTGGWNHRPSRIATIYSDDAGRTWERGEMLPDTIRNMNETVAVQLRDGSVLLNIRNEAADYRRAVSISRDGASGWSTPRFDPNLKEPICMGNILRLPDTQDGRGRILFSNPDTLDLSSNPAADGKWIERKNVSVKLSYDDCRSWPVSKVIEPGLSGYTDLAVTGDGVMHLFFERGGIDGNIFVTRYLSLASFDLGWLEGCED